MFLLILYFILLFITVCALLGQSLVIHGVNYELDIILIIQNIKDRENLVAPFIIVKCCGLFRILQSNFPPNGEQGPRRN